MLNSVFCAWCYVLGDVLGVLAEVLELVLSAGVLAGVLLVSVELELAVLLAESPVLATGVATGALDDEEDPVRLSVL